METEIEIAVCITLLIVGLSHALHPRAWVDFFIRLREKGGAGVFAIALMHLPLAMLVIAFHNRWSLSASVVVTLLGWCSMLKAAIYLTVPRVGRMSLATVRPERAIGFVIAGLVSMALASVVGYGLLRR